GAADGSAPRWQHVGMAPSRSRPGLPGPRRLGVGECRTPEFSRLFPAMPAVPLFHRRTRTLPHSVRRIASQAFLCTDLEIDPLDILRWFVRRWSTEVTFAEVRRHLGVETQRQWSDPAVART